MCLDMAAYGSLCVNTQETQKPFSAFGWFCIMFADQGNLVSARFYMREIIWSILFVLG